MNKIHLKRTKRLSEGHLWIFSNELYESPKKYSPGSIIEVYDMQDSFIGTGYINPHSLISIRLLSRKKQNIDRAFFKKCLSDAIMLRERFFGTRDSLRLVYSEGDYLPGLIVDKYREFIVIQLLTLGMENFRELIIELLDEMLTPDVIILRNESRLRILEGLTQYKEIVKGNLQTLPVIEEDGLLFEVDPYEGQKTGFFLDQRGNRTALKSFIQGGKGIDLFCYVGAWSMHLASAGADITGVDSSDRAIRQACKNSELNGLQKRMRFIKEDVFSFLENELVKEKGKYDFIVLDPPAFAKSSGKIKEAIRAYMEINAMSMKLLRPGGILATSSCSYHISREMFKGMLTSAGKAAKRNLRLISMGSQGADHPVLLSMPETEYLKCAFLVVD